MADQRGSNYCADSGTVNSVNEREIAGKPNVAGAVIGGVAGHQFGSGKGNTAPTAGGAVGSQVAKGENSTVYDLVVRMDSGTTQTYTVAATDGRGPAGTG